MGINYADILSSDSIEETFSKIEKGSLSIDGLYGDTMEQRRIVYAHPCKMKQQMKKAIDMTVGYTTLDNPMEVEKIAETQNEMGKRIKVLIRIATHDEKSKFSFSTK